MLLNAETKKAHTPNLVKLKIITQDAFLKIKINDLMMTNIHGQLDQSPSADANSNYYIMFNEKHKERNTYQAKLSDSIILKTQKNRNG